MGPYCKYCNTRCFAFFPKWTPTHVLEAYRPGVTIIATCHQGQAAEKEATGYCWSDIQAMRPEASPADFIQWVMGKRAHAFLHSLSTRTLEWIHWGIAEDVRGCTHEGDVAYAHAWQRTIRLILAQRYEAEDEARVEAEFVIEAVVAPV